MAYRTLGKLFWNKELKDAMVTIIHRGAPGDIKEIKGERITEVKKGSFITLLTDCQIQLQLLLIHCFRCQLF